MKVRLFGGPLDEEVIEVAGRVDTIMVPETRDLGAMFRGEPGWLIQNEYQRMPALADEDGLPLYRWIGRER